MRTLKVCVAGAVVTGAIALATACGGNSTSTAGNTSPSTGCTPSSNPATFVIMNNAVCPTTLTIAVGGQITMSNQDSRTHQMYSDPHPEHTDCPELNQIGFLNSGQSLQSGNLNTIRSCGFHDHGDPNNNALKGTVVIK